MNPDSNFFFNEHLLLVMCTVKMELDWILSIKEKINIHTVLIRIVFVLVESKFRIDLNLDHRDMIPAHRREMLESNLRMITSRF